MGSLLHRAPHPVLIRMGERCRAGCAWFQGIMNLRVNNQQVSRYF